MSFKFRCYSFAEKGPNLVSEPITPVAAFTHDQRWVEQNYKQSFGYGLVSKRRVKFWLIFYCPL